jgi:hypothetical protein
MKAADRARRHTAAVTAPTATVATAPFTATTVAVTTAIVTVSRGNT